MTALLLALLFAGPIDEALPQLEDAVLSETAPAVPPKARNSWDRATRPQYFDAVTARWALTEQERRLLEANGFVVSGRFAQKNWADALHEVHRSEQPLFVSSDAVLHAVFRSHERFLSSTEETVLAPKLVELVRKLHLALPEARAQWPKEVGADLDFYLRVARLLAVDKAVRATAAEAQWVQRIVRARGIETVSLFGRSRRIDFSAFQPRGHYVKDGLQSYFRLFTWLSRLELNLKSRASASSSPVVMTEETPREALDALALAELVERSGTARDWQEIERLLEAFAGRREDVSIEQLAALRKQAHIETLTLESTKAFREAIGDGFQRRLNTHVAADSSVPLVPVPVISTLLGVRLTPEADALGPTTFDYDAVKVAYVLGSDRALDFAQADVAEQKVLAEARAKLVTTRSDMYAQWLAAVRALSERPRGVVPSFAEQPAWSHKQLDSTLVAYGQLRHNYVLLASEPYEAGGCKVPDAFVEPALGVYSSLEGWAQSGVAVCNRLRALGFAPAASAGQKYFERLAKLMRVLQTLSRQELANQPLSANGQKFLASVVELYALLPKYLGQYGAKYDGWYFNLFFDRSKSLMGSAELIASVFTSPRANKVSYVGARTPELGFFVVDTAGPARLMVGPVARGFVKSGPINSRFDDDAVTADFFRQKFHENPWASAYRSSSDVFLNLLVEEEKAVTGWSTVEGPLTFRLMGEHGAVLWTETKNAGRLAAPELDGPGPPLPVGRYGVRTKLPAALVKDARLIAIESGGAVSEFELWSWAKAQPQAEERLEGGR